MTVLYKRNRVVTFRVSAEEFSAIEEICRKSDVRSVSDFARAAVRDRIKALEGSKGLLTSDLLSLGTRLSELDSALLDIRRAVGRVLGSVSPPE